MNDFPSSKVVEGLKKRYPKGARVKLIMMDDLYAPPVGTLGTVMWVDDIGSIKVAWDNGSKLAVAYGVDCCMVVDWRKTIKTTEKWEIGRNALFLVGRLSLPKMHEVFTEYSG